MTNLEKLQASMPGQTPTQDQLDAATALDLAEARAKQIEELEEIITSPDTTLEAKEAAAKQLEEVEPVSLTPAQNHAPAVQLPQGLSDAEKRAAAQKLQADRDELAKAELTRKAVEEKVKAEASAKAQQPVVVAVETAEEQKARFAIELVNNRIKADAENIYYGANAFAVWLHKRTTAFGAIGGGQLHSETMARILLHDFAKHLGLPVGTEPAQL